MSVLPSDWWLSIHLSIHPSAPPPIVISLLRHHSRYLRPCALMYAIFKVDLNTPHVELLDSRTTTQQNGSRCHRSQHPIQCKCPLNPVNPPSQHGGAQQESEEARGKCDMVPPPPRWEPIQETSAHEARKLTVTWTQQQLNTKNKKNIVWESPRCKEEKSKHQ